MRPIPSGSQETKIATHIGNDIPHRMLAFKAGRRLCEQIAANLSNILYHSNSILAAILPELTRGKLFAQDHGATLERRRRGTVAMAQSKYFFTIPCHTLQRSLNQLYNDHEQTLISAQPAPRLFPAVWYKGKQPYTMSSGKILDEERNRLSETPSKVQKGRIYTYRTFQEWRVTLKSNTLTSFLPES